MEYLAHTVPEIDKEQLRQNGFKGYLFVDVLDENKIGFHFRYFKTIEGEVELMMWGLMEKREKGLPYLNDYDIENKEDFEEDLQKLGLTLDDVIEKAKATLLLREVEMINWFI